MLMKIMKNKILFIYIFRLFIIFEEDYLYYFLNEVFKTFLTK